MTWNDYYTSFVRTAVPVVVGALIASKAGPFIAPDAAVEFVTAGFALIYYAAVRGLEMLGASQAGWFLGTPRQPMYVAVDTGDLAVVDESDRLPEDPQ